MKPLQIILFVLIAVLLIGVGYLGYKVYVFPKIAPSPSPSTLVGEQQFSQETSYTGTIEPLKNLPGDDFVDPDGTPSGLLTNSGDYYVLVGNIDATLTVGEKISATGTIDSSITIPHYLYKAVLRVTNFSVVR